MPTPPPVPPAPGASVARNRRLLVIDDNRAIHEDVRKILCPSVSEGASAMDALEAELLGDSRRPSARDRIRFEVDSAYQGREGLTLVEKACAEHRPYAMAVVDVRMPPGWDGIETTAALWKVQPDLQIVICTAYSDYTWDDMLERLGCSDRLVILRKPFDAIELLQLGSCLTEKWSLTHAAACYAAELEHRVRQRTAELEAANQALQAEVSRRAAVEAVLVRATASSPANGSPGAGFLAKFAGV